MSTALRTVPDLRSVVDRAARELADADAADVLRWAHEEFGGGLAVTASMQDNVLVHLASRVVPGIDVLFLDTGYHFAETIGTADAIEATYDVTLHRLLPELSVGEQDARHGARLHDRDPDRCCAMRKVAPLEKALRGYEAWASGARRSESAARADTPVVVLDEFRGSVKLSPLAAWSDSMVASYVEEHQVLTNPLLGPAYPSIGCAPCTRAVLPGEDARAGRWSGFAKTECGVNQ